MSDNCEHKFVYLDSRKTTDGSGYQTEFKRVDRFFCEKCLEHRETVRREWSRETPDWY